MNILLLIWLPRDTDKFAWCLLSLQDFFLSYFESFTDVSDVRHDLLRGEGRGRLDENKMCMVVVRDIVLSSRVKLSSVCVFSKRGSISANEPLALYQYSA